MSVLGGWNIFAGESRYVLDPPPSYRRAQTIDFLSDKCDYEGLMGGGDRPSHQDKGGGLRYPKAILGFNSETRHIPGTSRNRAHPMHVKHSPRAAMFDANGALAPGLHPPTHPCQIVSHAAAAGSVCISFMSEASLYLRQRA